MTDFYKRENNNFSLVRMLCAYIVIYAHSHAISPNGTQDFIVRLSHCTHSGQLAVFVFVFLSGLFTIRSIKKENVKTFLIKRFFRIYPMLLITVFGVVVMGALITSLPLKEYFFNKETLKYIIKNIVEIENWHTLPGVFSEHPNQGVNGVLWYITFQLRIYVFLAISKSLNLFEDKTVSNIFFIVIIILELTIPETIPFLGNKIYGIPDFPEYVVTFFIAGLIYNNMFNLNLKFYHVIISLVFAFCASHISPQNALPSWAVFAIIFALWLGTHRIILKFSIPDLSYEIFLLGWPTSQMVEEFFPGITPLKNTLVTFVVVTLLAYICNELVSKNINKFTTRIVERFQND